MQSAYQSVVGWCLEYEVRAHTLLVGPDIVELVYHGRRAR
jgi:hypothetical protein